MNIPGLLPVILIFGLPGYIQVRQEIGEDRGRPAIKLKHILNLNKKK